MPFTVVVIYKFYSSGSSTLDGMYSTQAMAVASVLDRQIFVSSLRVTQSTFTSLNYTCNFDWKYLNHNKRNENIILPTCLPAPKHRPSNLAAFPQYGSWIFVPAYIPNSSTIHTSST